MTVSYDRFQFEQTLLSTWGIVEDLRDLNRAVLETDLSKDDISNVLLGIEVLYNIRFDDLFRQFEASIATPDDLQDLRRQLASKQAELDEVMLEYCPGEMSKEQLDNYEQHQVAVIVPHDKKG